MTANVTPMQPQDADEAERIRASGIEQAKRFREGRRG